MKTRRFGRSGLAISELVFGGGWVGGLLLHQDDDTKLKAIRRALEAGINWIDTAASYGQGKSEQALGWLLKEVEPRPHVSTKFEIDLQRLDDIPGQIERSLHASLGRLDMGSVDLLQLHNRIEPELGDRGLTVEEILGKNGVADSLDRLRDQGLFKLVGITALGDAACCRQVIESERFDSAQVYYNLLNPSAGLNISPEWSGHDFSGVIATCKAHDVAVMNIRVFAAGVLATDERHGREVVITRNTDVNSEEEKTRKTLELLGEGYGTRAQTAIRFSLANPDIACVVVGLAELSHLEQAIGGAELGPLPDDAVAKLQSLWR